ncbi:hypothetical protein FSP39_003035 [Pinctada imbricata]|uniref:Uncharacterized protein n=1 Tax=Pinctada imbricata TaxID=66713 RepID=A0AA88YB20_PINIB|nr:hypothetical protein FSP39_003035 [Pinctada imbricata]
MDCTVEEMVTIGKTECCTMEGVVGCCKKGERWNQMIAIGVGIGVTFVVMATLCFYCLWCKVDTIPCLGRLQKRLERKYYVVEKKLPCCASRVERRKMEEEIMKRSKDQPAFSLPPDVQDRTNKDEWWNGQFIKNS